MNRFLLVSVFLIAVIISISLEASSLRTLDGPTKKNVYVSYGFANNWLALEFSGVSVGDSRYYPNTTDIIHQAITMSVSLDNGECFNDGTICYAPFTVNHKIIVSVPYYLQNPSTLRITNPIGFDNNQVSTVNPLVQYSLDTLWSFLIGYALLPIPSPWGLILVNAPRFTITINQDLQGATASFNYNPGIQSLDYLWYIDKIDGSIPTGWYYVDVNLKVDLWLSIYSYGYSEVYVGTYTIWLSADFLLYDSDTSEFIYA